MTIEETRRKLAHIRKLAARANREECESGDCPYESMSDDLDDLVELIDELDAALNQDWLDETRRAARSA